MDGELSSRTALPLDGVRVFDVSRPLPGGPARLPGPAAGEHTAAVLRSAGYGRAEIAALERSGPVRASEP